MSNVSKYCPPYILGLEKETPRNVFVRWSVAKISEFLPLFNVLSFSVARVASFFFSFTPKLSLYWCKTSVNLSLSFQLYNP